MDSYLDPVGELDLLDDDQRPLALALENRTPVQVCWVSHIGQLWTRDLGPSAGSDQCSRGDRYSVIVHNTGVWRDRQIATGCECSQYYRMA